MMEMERQSFQRTLFQEKSLLDQTAILAQLLGFLYKVCQLCGMTLPACQGCLPVWYDQIYQIQIKHLLVAIFYTTRSFSSDHRFSTTFCTFFPVEQKMSLSLFENEFGCHDVCHCSASVRMLEVPTPPLKKSQATSVTTCRLQMRLVKSGQNKRQLRLRSCLTLHDFLHFLSGGMIQILSGSTYSSNASLSLNVQSICC